MLEEVELYVFDKYIKGLVVEEKGEKKIYKEELEKLHLSPHERNFIMYIINKQKIKMTEEKITRADRSPYVRDNNYGDIQTNNLQKKDEPVKSKIEYSDTNEKVFEDYQQLDEYLEKRFIPTYVLLKKKKTNGNVEYYQSIRLHHIMALKLSEAELEHVMNYLKDQNIRVGGKGSTLDSEFENYDYVTTYKESALPQSVPKEVTLQKIKNYKQTKDKKIRDEILTDNMRLVPYVAYRYAISTKINQHELESYGYEGLMLALEKFDVNYGCVFSTYAISYIRGYILSGIEEIFLGKRDKFYYEYIKIKNAIEEYHNTTVEESPELIENIITFLMEEGKLGNSKDSYNIAKAKINKIMENSIGYESLDDEEVLEKLTNSGELVDYHDYAEEAIASLSNEELDAALSTLTKSEERVIRLRFGLDDGRARTLEEVGREFNATRERIRQIEVKALRKLRHPARSRLLRNYLDQANEYHNITGKKSR